MSVVLTCKEYYKHDSKVMDKELIVSKDISLLKKHRIHQEMLRAVQSLLLSLVIE